MGCVLLFGVADHLIVDGSRNGNKSRTVTNKESTMDEYLVLLPAATGSPVEVRRVARHDAG